MLICALILLLFGPEEPEPEQILSPEQRKKAELVSKRKELREARIKRHKKSIEEMKEVPEIRKEHERLRRRLALGDKELVRKEQERKQYVKDYSDMAKEAEEGFEKYPNPDYLPLLERWERQLSLLQPEYFWYSEAAKKTGFAS